MGRAMTTPELWWVGAVPRDRYQPKVKIDQFIKQQLTTLSEVQYQVARTLKVQNQVANKLLGHFNDECWEVG